MFEPPSTAESGPDPCAARIAQACDAVGQFVEYWGFKAIHGRVWTLLALRAEPTTQAKIARTLGVSRALVSGSIAELSQFGLVHPTSDQRNAPYEAVMDVWPTIADVLRGREWMLLETARLSLEAAREEIRLMRQRGQPVRYSEERLQFLLTMTELAQSLLKSLIGLRTPRALASVRLWADRAATFIQGVRRGL